MSTRNNEALRPVALVRNPKWLAGISLGGALLGLAISSACTGHDGDSVTAERDLELEPGRFILTETSWGTDPAPAPRAAAANDDDDDEWLDFEDLTRDEDERERLAEQARERWQNLDIAVRGR